MTRPSSLLLGFSVALAGCTGGILGLGSSSDGDKPGVALEATCPPPDTFGAALCLCEDFAEVGELSVVEGPAGIGAVGVNGFTYFVNLTRAVGDWIGYAGFDAATDTAIDGSLMTSGDASWVGQVSVGGDLAVGGDASGVGELDVAGSLRVGGEEHLLGPATVGSRAEFEALAGPPCACDPDTFFDVGAAVAAAREANDDDAAGLPSRLAAVGQTDITLGAGTYYFEDAATVGQTHFTITAPVSIFVDGDIDAVGEETFTLQDGATLDLFVAGSVNTVGWLDAGSATDPEAFRLYVGGADPVHIASVGEQSFIGNIYAPSAAIAYVGDTTVVGSLFGRSLAGVGRLELGYGAPADLDPPSCEPPDDGGDGSGDGGDGSGDGVE